MLFKPTASQRRVFKVTYSRKIISGICANLIIIALAGTIVNRLEDLQEAVVATNCDHIE